MPLLRWDQTLVIQNWFWIYIAFTIPSTAVVFGVWNFTPKIWLPKEWIPQLAFFFRGKMARIEDVETQPAFDSQFPVKQHHIDI
jgi:hypothetical protein